MTGETTGGRGGATGGCETEGAGTGEKELYHFHSPPKIANANAAKRNNPPNTSMGEDCFREGLIGGTGAVICRGWPHLGQLVALSETSFEHSGHVVSDITQIRLYRTSLTTRSNPGYLNSLPNGFCPFAIPIHTKASCSRVLSELINSQRRVSSA